MDSNIFEEHLVKHGLGEEAGKLTNIILENCLTWKIASRTERVDAIVAFAFGNRIDEFGNRTPGPINALLADVVESAQAQLNCPVYAQWEIAQGLYGRIAPEQLTSINPQYDSQSDQVIYLSTAGIVKQLESVLEKNSSLYVVAHHDHLYRCVQTAARFGFPAVSDSAKMPVEYDPHSSQAWTRNRDTYLVSDMISRLAAVRAELIKSS